MKDFFKFTFATMCGIIMLTILGGILFMISIVGMIASGSATTKVEDNSVFVLKLNAVVEERADDENPLTALFGSADMETMGLDDIISNIRKAKDNDKIKGIYIEGGAASFDSPATAQQVRDALVDFKKSGKWIIAYADQYMQSGYYVASVADSIFISPTGMVNFCGLGGKSEYLTGLYEKIGVRYQATRVGKYKSAVERQTLKGMSDNDREQRTVFLQGVWQHMLADMAASRKVTAEQLDKLASDSIIALADQNDYVKAKLVDRVIYADEIKNVIKGKLGIDKDDDIKQLTLSDMMNIDDKKKDDGDEIAIYYAYGEILDEPLSGLSTGHAIIGSEMCEDINNLADDDDVKAVVIRVNSPGGSAAASQQIWHAIELLKAKKPVVVSMGGYAASGGYMISAPANFIVAEPTTLTGSIGIFGLFPNLSGLLQDKLGVTFDGVKTNEYTDFMENITLEKDNSKELAFMQTYIDRGYESFLNIVAKGRNMKRDEVHEIAQGRVWLATDALKIKLVDKIGSLDDAVKKAAELAKVEKEYHSVVYPDNIGWFERLMNKDEKGSYLDEQMRNTLGELYEPVMQMRLDKQRNRIQARLPFKVEMK